jgi:hypothetical protein
MARPKGIRSYGFMTHFKSENSWFLVFSFVLHLAHGLRYLVEIPVLERYILAIYHRPQTITQWTCRISRLCPEIP